MKANLHRGIISIGNKNTLLVKGVGAIYDLPPLIEPIEFNLNDKVVGVVIDGKFNIVFNFKLSVGTNHFGYYSKKGIEDTFKIQTIIGFNPLTFDAYSAEYELGNEIELDRNQIKSVTV